jgi:signal transduction histidine kinase/ActR/RegA family two-component response regulator
MALGTVRVPEGLEPLFREAEKLVSQFFAEQRQDPTRGTIEIVGERYLLVRAAALSVEFFQVVDDLYGEHRRDEGETFARNILFDLAHALGKSDARNFQAKMKLDDDPIAKLSAGPVHFAYSGWAFVEISPESRPTPDDKFYLLYDHPYSFESDAWLRAGKSRDFPVCIMNAGYSSGWCEESFGMKLVASEIMCRARHDETCRFIMAHPDKIESHVVQYRAAKPHLAHQVRNYQIPDFFARKRMEEDLRRGIEDRTRELQAANAALRKEIEEREAAEKKLRQVHKLEAIASLAGGIAHDFNNLIAIMLTRTSRLASRLAHDDPVRGELAEIQTAAERAAQLTRKLLAFGQVEVLQRQVIDVDVVLGELAPLLTSLVGEDTTLELRPAGGSSIVGDRSQLEQLVLNLVLNAREAMPRGGRLVVETSTIDVSAPLSLPTGMLAPGRYVRLVVEDTGVGMDEDTMSRMFDPFFTTKPLAHGTGLGLSTVYGIVRGANGGIGVTSAVGSGTRFTLHLPAAARSPERAVKPAVKPVGGTETILVVEDQHSLGEAIRDTLEDYGYRVVLVDPEAAIALVSRGEHVDLLVTDVVMPRISGSELAQRISVLRPAIKVMFMSGYTRDAVLRKGIVDQTATFLAKPFLPDQLVRTVRLALDGKPCPDGKP